MSKWLQMLRPSGWMVRKLGLVLLLSAVGIGAFCWGRRGTSFADANPPYAPGQIPQMPVGATPGANPDEYSRRVVAYIYDNVPISRAELGEYLIARFGAERLEFLINRKLVEMACATQGVTVTDAEVENQLRLDLQGFGSLTQDQFVNQVLRRFNKTLYEWKEDVIRPKLLITKLVRPTVHVTHEDLMKAFEGKYGPKVQCRMIVTNNDAKVAQQVWERAHQSRAAFLAEAKQQAIPALASKEGEVPPIHKHFGDTRMEEVAFRLKEGEVSGLIQLKDENGGYVILMCEKHLKEDISKRFEEEHQRLSQEVAELKLAQRVPEVFNDMRQRANPRKLLTTPAAQQPLLAVDAPTPQQPTPIVTPPPPRALPGVNALPVSSSAPNNPVVVPPPPSAPSRPGLGIAPSAN